MKKPGDISEDPLTELLRASASKLITDAVEVELQKLLKKYAGLRNELGHRQIIRNEYPPVIFRRTFGLNNESL